MKSLNLPHNPKIDQIRCLAASLVFFFHFYHYYFHPSTETLAKMSWAGIVTEGHTGVGLFFTLSGFLFMQIAIHHDKIDYGNFVRNRFLRIFPLFTTVFVVAISIGRDKFHAQDIFYLFFSNLGEAPTSASFITGAAWTISLEFTFYLVFPFLGRFALARGPSYLLQLLALMLLFKLGAYSVSERSTHMLFSTLVGRFDQFLIGMLAAQLYDRHQVRIGKLWKVILPLACLLVVFNSALQARYGSFYSPLPKQIFWITWSMQESLGWSIFIVAWISAKLPLPRWLDASLTQGGNISFSFYLLHGLVIYLAYLGFGFPRFFGEGWIDGLTVLLPVYAATWAVATLSFKTIEQPFLGLRRRYGN